MKATLLICFGVVLCAVCLCPAAGAATTNEVFALALSASGSFQDDQGGTPVIGKVKISSLVLLNLAMGRAPSTAAVAGEALAAAVEDSGETGAIIVYDTNAHTNKALIAQAKDGVRVSGGGRSAFAVVMDVKNAGQPGFRINGGGLMVNGKVTGIPGAGGKVSGTVDGFLSIRITDDTGTHDVEVVIPKGKATLGTHLGQVVLP
jgi:hypothetical protein